MALGYFQTKLKTWMKAGDSIVTEADIAVNDLLQKRLAGARPDYGWLSEETEDDADRLTRSRIWVVDPIDGTRAFISGLPTWGTLIGLLHNGNPTYGMLVQPFTRECFSGDGQVARWRGPGRDHAQTERKLKARACAKLAEATLMTTSPLLYPPAELQAFKRVEGSVSLSRYGYDCYAFAMLAAGHVDCVMEAGVQTYDIAPLIPIIQGAGGLVTDWTGGSVARGGNVLAVGDPRIHAQIVELLAG